MSIEFQVLTFNFLDSKNSSSMTLTANFDITVTSFQAALTGWYLRFAEDDHKIAEIEVNITKVAQTGSDAVAVTVEIFMNTRLTDSYFNGTVTVVVIGVGA